MLGESVKKYKIVKSVKINVRKYIFLQEMLSVREDIYNNRTKYEHVNMYSY